MRKTKDNAFAFVAVTAPFVFDCSLETDNAAFVIFVRPPCDYGECHGWVIQSGACKANERQ